MNVNHENKQGKNALGIAIKNRDLDMCEILLEYEVSLFQSLIEHASFQKHFTVYLSGLHFLNTKYINLFSAYAW